MGNCCRLRIYPGNSMKNYLTAIKYPLISWIIYILSLSLLNHYLTSVELITLFTNHYSIFFIIAFAFWVLVNCYRMRFSFGHVFKTIFLFMYIASFIIWAGYIYSESLSISRSSDVYLAVGSLILYPLIAGIIAGTILSSIYSIVFRIRKK